MPFESGGTRVHIRLSIKGNDRRGNLGPTRRILSAHDALRNRVQFRSEADLPRQDLAVFILAQLAGPQDRLHLAQRRRDVELNHGRETAVNALDSGRVGRLTLSRGIAQRNKRQLKSAETQ